MMQGIYISQDLSHAGGIQDKIFKQIHEIENQNIKMDRYINPKRNIGHLFLNIVPFFSVQYFGTKNIRWDNYAFAYIRKGAIFDKSVISLLKKAKKDNPNLLVILEIPTYPYLNEFKSWLKVDVAWKEKKWVPYLANYVDRIVTYSDDEKIFGIPCINISNAYNFDHLPSIIESETNVINLLGVAALCFYHGYDRVIEGLSNYYSKEDRPNKIVNFTLVGDGPVLNEYRKLVQIKGLSNHVYLTGRKDFTQLSPYYQKADIGIDSLGRHRSGVAYNSSLKGKEYLANGLPIISGVKTDLDGVGFKYYLRVPADDTALDIPKIIAWHDQICLGKTKKEVATEIFKYGEQHFTFEKTFEPVIKYIEEATDGRFS